MEIDNLPLFEWWVTIFGLYFLKNKFRATQKNPIKPKQSKLVWNEISIENESLISASLNDFSFLFSFDILLNGFKIFDIE